MPNKPGCVRGSEINAGIFDSTVFQPSSIKSKQNYEDRVSRQGQTSKLKLMPEDTRFLGIWNTKLDSIRGEEVVIGEGCLLNRSTAAMTTLKTHGCCQERRLIKRWRQNLSTGVLSVRTAARYSCPRCLRSRFAVTTTFRLARLLWSGQCSSRSRLMRTTTCRSIIFAEPKTEEKGIKCCAN